MRPAALAAALALVAGTTLAQEQESDAARAAGAARTVGVPGELRDVVLPGSELAVADADDETPVVLRIAAARPHGDAWRYDLVWDGLEPGDWDLAAVLRRVDGSGTADLPPLPVRVTSVLPPGQVEPHRPGIGELPRIGGYRALLVLAGVLWLAGLAALLFWGRRREDAEAVRAREITLAERLRPLVTDALAGKLSRREHAELELALVALWRRRLGLEALPPQDALAEIARHPEAGALLCALETWLHRGDVSADVDLDRLLAPYRELPSEELETAAAGAW
jgi:hypothetical protein